jgi:putative molybdopterin biosynthesis protein
VIRLLAGLPEGVHSTATARLAVKVNSEIGRTEYLLVGLVEVDEPGGTSAPTAASGPSLVAFPMGKGSGSVTTFSRADGFVTIGRQVEMLAAGSPVEVRLIGREWRVADLVVIGSHCIGLDYLLTELQARGWHTKFLAVGSTAGLEAARRGECDLAGIHLLDLATGQYNEPFVSAGLEFIRGYDRQQGVVFRRDDPRFERFSSAEQAIAAMRHESDCLMINRHQGSGTRVLIDQALQGAKPKGYAVQPRSHHAVAAAVAQGRADWGVTILGVAAQSELGFLPLRQEQFDFVSPASRRRRPACQAFVALLQEPAIQAELRRRGFSIPPR